MLLYGLLAVWFVGFLFSVRYMKDKWPANWATSSYLLAAGWPIALLGLGLWVLIWKLKK